MCGVAATFAYHDAAPDVDRGELARSLDSMASRGPDGAGTWFAANGRLAVGHRRLALLDPSPLGAQPMVGRERGVVLAWNGEIYNHEALRATLLRDGHAVPGRSDTAVLLRLYEAYGRSCFSMLRGMFSIVLFDPRLGTAGSLLLVRDPYGVKPLYYADDGWSVRVASQVTALRATGRVSGEVEPAARVGFFLTGSIPEPLTMLREVRAVPAGTVLQFDALGARAPEAFIDLRAVLSDATSNRLDPDPERAQAAVGDAVRLARSADAEVGVFLSDGIDSSLVLRHATAGGAAPPSLTLLFEDDAGAEAGARIASRAARACGSAHSTHVVTTADFHRALPRILACMDQPSIDGVNVWFASEAAADRGWRAALTGIGGDELLGGYPSFRDVPRWTRFAALPGAVPGLGMALRVAMSRLLMGRVPPKAAGVIEYARTLAGSWLLRRGVFMPWELPGLIGREAAMEGMARLAPLRRIQEQLTPMPTTDYGRVAVLESCLYLRNQLLRDADWAAMAHSVEVRVPFSDHCLAREALPAMVRDGGDKARLHRSAPLPEAAARQPTVKRGFHVPFDRWLDGIPAMDAWRRVPVLKGRRIRPARRWAYVVADAKGLL